MLQKVGQTIAKLKAMSAYINRIVINKFKSPNKEESGVVEAASLHHIEKESLKAKQTEIGLPQSFDNKKSGQGELLSTHILSKIGSGQKVLAHTNKTSGSKVSQTSSKKIRRTMNDYQYKEEQEGSHYSNFDTKDDKHITERMNELQKELSEALEQWKWTRHAYDYALGSEQVDFCIYQMMAAEQKYRMILVKARELQVEWSKVKGDMI